MKWADFRICSPLYWVIVLVLSLLSGGLMVWLGATGTYLSNVFFLVLLTVLFGILADLIKCWREKKFPKGP